MHEGDGRMNDKTKTIVSFCVCSALSLGLLGWIVSRMDWAETWKVFKNADPWILAAAGLLFLSTNFIILWRWKVLMKAMGLKCKTFNAARWYFIGNFCNLLPLTTVGGDIFKGIGLSKETGQRPKVFASIVVDRLAGFTGIVITACIAFLLGKSIIQSPLVLFSIAMMAAVSLLLAVVLFSRRIFYKVGKLFAFWPALNKGLMALHQDIMLLRGKQMQGFGTIGISILAQLVLAFEFYLTARAMHQDIDLMYFIIFSPLVCVATALPSIGGLGVREVGWVTLLSKVGVSHDVAGGISIINSLFVLLVGLMGGLFYVATLSPRRLQHHQASANLGGSNA